ncbi:hypothetical protein [Flavobacterium xinjiangense]|uniref:Uncharacterized protein n=1 Tax=Flavobacterium xinjiangense TaxID=178356 RepID=A0A1M7FP19_9FLAO|nr:hypothetical protein [Flavobacterium xinjiangense]SHM05449.1 hypothetical protein SAMN05216269_102209 [Flavobacterium xinjiangense]
MKKLLFKGLLLLSIVSNANAQAILEKIDPYSSGVLFRNPNFDNRDLVKIEGSQYLNQDYKLAEVSGVTKKLLVRYNAMTDAIEVQDEDMKGFLLTKQNPYNTITIISNPNKIKLINYKNKEGEVYGYLSELHNKNNVILYRRDKIILQKALEARTTYQEAVPQKFVKIDDEYYLSLKNDMATAVPKNKKELQNLFPMKKEEIAVYLKDNKFSLKDEKSIIEMVKFISTL